MKSLSPSALKDLALAKAVFQARALEMILAERPKAEKAVSNLETLSSERSLENGIK